jgi:cobalt-zinc-cadmium efflux system protein
LISLFIAVLIARGAWIILGETVGVLMEATPKGLDVLQLAHDVMALPHVTDVHDLHVWSIAGGMPALSAHLQVAEDCSLSACDCLLGQVNHLLEDHYGIAHSTIQFEYACCDRHEPDDLYCGAMGGEEAAHDHLADDHAAHDAGARKHEHVGNGMHIHG